MSCQNNLKQIGLALMNFESAHKFFPPARLDAAPGFPVVEFGVPEPVTGVIQHGPGTLILPFLEQGSVYSLYDFKQHWSSAANAAAIATPISTFICPSTPEGNRIDTGNTPGSTSPPRWLAAVSDYSIANGMNGRLGLSPFNLIPPIPGYSSTDPNSDAFQYVGAILPMSTISFFTTGMSPPFYNKRVKSRFANIVDGSSNTLAWVEDAGRPFLYRGNKKISGLRASGAGWADPDSEFWVDGFTADGVTSLGPCVVNCNSSNEIYSFHVGGAMTLYCDGSVRFMNSSVTLPFIASIVSAQLGEVPMEQ